MMSYDPISKRMGGYLVDAGLLTKAQVDVTLCDQQATGMRFGDIIVERGWITRKTIEYISDKVIELEREIGEPLNLQVVKASVRVHQKHLHSASVNPWTHSERPSQYR
jgi:hypothetical protein